MMYLLCTGSRLVGHHGLDLGEVTHTSVVPCWMLEPLPPRDQVCLWFGLVCPAHGLELDEPTHTLVIPRWMPKSLPPRD